MFPLDESLSFVDLMPSPPASTVMSPPLIATKSLPENFNDAFSKIITFEKIYHPDPKNNQVYEELFLKWKEVYKKQLELADSRLTDNMWIAPGLK